MSKKIIVGLEGHGLVFKMFLRNIGIDSSQKYHESGARSDLEFIYNESASQIVMIYESDPQRFLVRLMQLPDVKFFNHLHLFSDLRFIENFIHGFREFALGLMFQIHKVLGTRSDVDYLLEAIADDYIILYQGPNGVNHA